MTANIVRILRDMRDSIEDGPRMRALAAHTTAEVNADPPTSVPAVETAEVIEFLRGLADDHFSFLGSRGVPASGSCAPPNPSRGG
jgi:glutamate dehydrogenase